MITITPAAQEKLDQILQEETSMKYVRLQVSGGGCSGFKYGFSLEEAKQEDDMELSPNMIVDPMSFQYLDNSTVEFVKTVGSESFEIRNPQVTSTCGCGSSFSI
jgi:iron-sulfur cluster insertion protein